MIHCGIPQPKLNRRSKIELMFSRIRDPEPSTQVPYIRDSSIDTQGVVSKELAIGLVEKH